MLPENNVTHHPDTLRTIPEDVLDGFTEPPRSACVFCPYHSDAEWARLKREEPESFAFAARFEAVAAAACQITKGVPFLHASLKPLPQVRFRESTEVQPGLAFTDECEGLCGV